MNTIRITFAALALAACGITQASEITEFPLEKSIKSRTEVQAEARGVRQAPGELYDGRHLGAKASVMASMKTRDEVRMEARVARSMVNPAAANDLVGGM
jgi:hypothetical protein